MIAIREYEGDIVMPKSLTPCERTVDCGLKGFINSVMDWRDNGIEYDWDENKRYECKTESVECDEKEKEKKSDPSDTGVGEEEREREENEKSAREYFFFEVFCKTQEKKNGDTGKSREVETEDIRMAEGAEDPGNGNVFIDEADTIDELIDAEENRKERGEKDCQENGTYIIARSHHCVCKKSDTPNTKKTKKFLDPEDGRYGKGNRENSPEKNDEEWGVERVGSKVSAETNEGDEADTCNADSEYLREGGGISIDGERDRFR